MLNVFICCAEGRPYVFCKGDCVASKCCGVDDTSSTDFMRRKTSASIVLSFAAVAPMTEDVKRSDTAEAHFLGTTEKLSVTSLWNCLSVSPGVACARSVVFMTCLHRLRIVDS